MTIGNSSFTIAPGQFTQPDPLIPDPLDPAAWNRFSYVYGNPVNFTDPSEHFAVAPWDLLDIVSFGASLNDFVQNPTLGNLAWLALDTVSLLPLLPGLGAVHHLGKLDEVGDAARVARGGPVWDANVQRWRDAKGRFAKPPNVLDRSSIRWSQESVSNDVYWASAGKGKGARISILKAAERLKAGEMYPGDPMLVFRKTPEMNNWPMTKHPKFGRDWASLENGVIYSINNRTLTVFTVAKVDQIPVQWATREQIIEFSYQYSAYNYGKFIKFRYYP